MVCSKDYHLSIVLLRMLETLCEVDQHARTIIEGCAQNISIRIGHSKHIGVAMDSSHIAVTTKELQHAVQIIFPNVSHLITVLKDPSQLCTYIKAEQTNKRLEDLFHRIAETVFFSEESDLGSYIKLVATIHMAVWIGNETDEGRVLAARMPDGRLQVRLVDGRMVNVICKHHSLTIVQQPKQNARAIIEYSSATVATRLLSHSLNSFSCIVSGDYAVKGFIPMIDPFEKLLIKGNKYMLTRLEGD